MLLRSVLSPEQPPIGHHLRPLPVLLALSPSSAASSPAALDGVGAVEGRGARLPRVVQAGEALELAVYGSVGQVVGVELEVGLRQDARRVQVCRGCGGRGG